MPLHDWATTAGWAKVHTNWMTELARHIKPTLPQDYRARIETDADSDLGQDVGGRNAWNHSGLLFGLHAGGVVECSQGFTPWRHSGTPPA